MSETTEVETETITYRQAIRDAIKEEMHDDERVMMLGEDLTHEVGVFGVTAGLSDEFGDGRIRDTPISEAGVVGAAVGAAINGVRPIVEIGFCDFFAIAGEQVLNQIAPVRYMFDGQVSIPITLMANEGGGLSAAGQHSKTIHPWFTYLPGIKVVSPGTPGGAKGLLKASIRSDDPVVFFEHKRLYSEEGEVPTGDDVTVPIGKASVEREGSDVTVVATQHYVLQALEVADDLSGDVDVEVVDPRSLYPLDTETIVESVEKTGRLVVADESSISYGTHAEIVSRVAENTFYSLEAPPQRVGVPDVHFPFNPDLEDRMLPDGDDIERAIRRIT